MDEWQDDIGFTAESFPRTPVDQKKWQWLMQGISFLTVILASAAAIFYLPVFTIQSITVVGNSYVPAEDIARIAGVYKGEHVFQVETDRATETLKKDLRIEQATIRRTFPNGLIIEVTERRPVAVIGCEYGFLDLDRHAMVLNAYRVRHLQTIPLLDGVTARDIYIGDTVDDPIVKDALEYLSGLDNTALSQLVEVDISDPERVVAHTTNAAEIRIGTLERLAEKADFTRDFLENLRRTKHVIDYIDLTYSSPYIKLHDE